MIRRFIVLLVYVGLFCSGAAHAAPDAAQDILVTFRNDGASTISGSIRAPYRARKRYRIAAEAREDADAIASEFALDEIDHWPIRSLGVYCFVYRVPEGANRQAVIDRLRADNRVESVQALQEFDTGTGSAMTYNDTYARLQHGLDSLGIEAAHQLTRGSDVRIAIIDSDADTDHEDLRGRIRSLRNFAADNRPGEKEHGTAVASVIGASANNAMGIVGVAPEARLELLVACWAAANKDGAVCDSFTLAKALDTLVEDPPQILNMSLSGPDDALVGRLVDQLLQRDVVVVAADTAEPGERPGFPANLPGVISAGNSHTYSGNGFPTSGSVFAPGNQIMVAVPRNAYDFRSGSSLAAAHITGVVALFLAVSPDSQPDEVLRLLQVSQANTKSGLISVDACRMMNHANPTTACLRVPSVAHLENEANAQGDP